ncbi:MAG: 30S ribosomal protein S17e [Nanoarchaeota archaeon]|nr:30S ribosomal protein S17e [Nanoarchaeota archaeon]
MGRIRTSKIKSTTKDIMEINKNKFKGEFEHNKKALMEVADIPTKHLRNVIAGYITKLVNKEKSKSIT